MGKRLYPRGLQSWHRGLGQRSARRLDLTDNATSNRIDAAHENFRRTWGRVAQHAAAVGARRIAEGVGTTARTGAQWLSGAAAAAFGAWRAGSVMMGGDNDAPMPQAPPPVSAAQQVFDNPDTRGLIMGRWHGRRRRIRRLVGRIARNWRARTAANPAHRRGRAYRRSVWARNNRLFNQSLRRSFAYPRDHPVWRTRWRHPSRFPQWRRR